MPLDKELGHQIAEDIRKEWEREFDEIDATRGKIAGEYNRIAFQGDKDRDRLTALDMIVNLRGDKPAEKHEHKHTFEDLSDEELDRRIQQLAGALVGEKP